MRVKLIAATPNPIDVMHVAARTCYSEKSPIELWDVASKRTKKKTIEEENKKWGLVKTVLASGHSSIAEHVVMTFAIEGIDRAVSHQLVRHRAGVVFSQKSQRYVEIKENYTELADMWLKISSGKDTPETAEAMKKALALVDKYFTLPPDGVIGAKPLFESLMEYSKAIQFGSKPENARAILPNATKTDLVMTINLRELMHVSNLRLCTRAQLGIRQLFKAIKDEVTENYNKNLGGLLVPTCETLGLCKEHKCCGRKPQLKSVLEAINNNNHSQL